MNAPGCNLRWGELVSAFSAGTELWLSGIAHVPMGSCSAMEGQKSDFQGRESEFRSSLPGRCAESTWGTGISLVGSHISARKYFKLLLLLVCS